MAVTRSTAAERTRHSTPFTVRTAAYRTRELIGLVAASLLVVAGVYLAYQGRVARLETPAPGPFDLTQLDRREQLLPYLTLVSSPVERQYVARKIADGLRDRGGEVPNVGTLARIRVPIREVLATKGLVELQTRAKELVTADKDAATLTLLTPAQVSRLKPLFVVRPLDTYRNKLILWTAVFLAMFYLVHFFWVIRGLSNSQSVLPVLHLLSGIGLVLMISLRDPIRDTLAFSDFVQGVALGCVALAAASLPDYKRLTGRLSYVPLLVSFLLSAALIVFGSGPGASDAKVNLLGFQPAELIRILIVFFLAGYFADRWEFLRTLREHRPEMARVSRWVEVPRLEYLLPVLIGVAVSLAFFFLQKDLGPALLIACLFLAMYAVARDRYLFAATGMALILAGFVGGYLLHFPRNVASRVSMWLSPWDNAVRGGDQVVHALWGMATGGLFGSGIGLGDPGVMPAAHTDLILAVLGEEWGFAGVLALFVLYAVLVWFGIRTALRAQSDYGFFLALGLTLTLALQVCLIAGGVLDLVPLSGVVLPFLSYGRTALITNFAIVGMLVALSREGGGSEVTQPFRVSTKAVAGALAAFCLLIVGKAAWVQIAHSDATVGAGALTLQADGFRRYQYNPRLLAIARSIPRGTIFDRNGLPAGVEQLGGDRPKPGSLRARRRGDPGEPSRHRLALLSPGRQGGPPARRPAHPGELGRAQQLARRARFHGRSAGL